VTISISWIQVKNSPMAAFFLTFSSLWWGNAFAIKNQPHKRALNNNSWLIVDNWQTDFVFVAFLTAICVGLQVFVWLLICFFFFLIFYFIIVIFFFVLSFMALSYAFPMLLTALSEGVLNIFYGLLCAPNNHFGFPPRATGIFGFKLHWLPFLWLLKPRAVFSWPSCVSCWLFRC